MAIEPAEMAGQLEIARGGQEVSELRSLARQIQRGECILFLGPGAAIVPGETPERPLSVALSEVLAADPRIAQVKGLDHRDLRHVSQVLYEETKNLTFIQETAADFYASRTHLTTPFHVNMAALPFRFCLTTTPDDCLFNAFVEAGKKPSRHFYSFRRGQASRPVEQPSPERPLIYHLYGYPDEPDSLVITENDLIDFVASVIRKTPPLAEIIRGQLANPTTTCLFADLGFKNWYLRALLRSVELFDHQDISVAIEDAEFFEQTRLHHTTLYFSRSRAIQFRRDSLDDFATQLRRTYEAILKRRITVEVPPVGAPKVFLSYFHEDHEEVGQLAERLTTSGIAVWQDKQKLRVGDRWEQLLADVIAKQVDYVVVVQSDVISRRIESYVGRETDEALKRSKDFLGHFNFVLPVKLGPASPSLAVLSELHAIDVSTAGGVGQLVSAIQEDWSRRAEHGSRKRAGA